jgi:protein-L-isoaspartate(D-aspartate) O-methyltransferase
MATMDFAAARRMMVDGQVRTSDVTEPRLLAAMFELPRERFVAEGRAGLAYLDLDVPVAEHGNGRTRHLLKPMVLAKLIQAADIKAGDHVLDVGAATGYSSALLAHLAASVVALEEEAALAEQAARNLGDLGLTQVSVVAGPLTAGCAERGPYDVILVNGATEVIPHALCGQLRHGGRLVCVLGRPPGGKGMLYYCDHGDVSGQPRFDAAAPLLPGFVKPAAFVF